MPDTIAILIPCYNAAQYLAQALDSALAQTRKAEQIIIVNDGSTDDSLAIAQRYEKEHPDAGFVIIDQPNAGEAAARNAGIAVATTTWIANLDADDWWEPEKLEKQLAAAAEAGPQCVLVHTAGRKVFPDGSTHEAPQDGAARRVGWATKALLEPTSMGHPSCMIRTEALRQIGGYDPAFKRSCDMDMYMRISAVGTFAFVPDRLVNYRAHDEQLSARQAEQIAEHHNAVRKFFRLHPQKLEEIGQDHVDAALAEHTRVKLESLYWRRSLGEFRQLLDYAAAHDIDSPAIQQWRKRSRWPNWLIRLKDRFDRSRAS